MSLFYNYDWWNLFNSCTWRGCVTLFLAIWLHTKLSKNRLKPLNIGFIPKKNIKQVLGNCNEVQMVKIGQDWKGLQKGQLAKCRADVFKFKFVQSETSGK